MEKQLKRRSPACTASKKGPDGCIECQQGSTQQPCMQQVNQVPLVPYGLLDCAIIVPQLTNRFSQLFR